MVVFNDVASIVISGDNCWKKRRVLMSVSLKGDGHCWSELFDLFLLLRSFSFYC